MLSECSSQVRPIVDYRQIKVQAGSGGDGCVSLASISKNPMAGPDGGDGGNGGHVVFKVFLRYTLHAEWDLKICFLTGYHQQDLSGSHPFNCHCR